MAKNKANQKPKQKKLTLKHIENENKKYSEMIKVEFDDNTYLHINKYFAVDKIDAMIKSFAESVAEMEKAGVKFDATKFHDFLMLHVFKFFSSLGEDIPDDFETKLKVFNILAKSDYAQKLAQAYDPKELAKVYDRLMELLEVINKSKEYQKQLRYEISKKLDELENGDIVREVLFKGALDELDAAETKDQTGSDKEDEVDGK